jgi:hypothetical protein
MPDDATEGVAKHSSRLQPSINMHAPVTAFMFSCTGTDVLPQRDEGSGKPCAVYQASWNIGTHSGLEPGTSGSTVQSSNHYTTAAHTAHTKTNKCNNPLFTFFSLFPPNELTWSADRWQFDPNFPTPGDSRHKIPSKLFCIFQPDDPVDKFEMNLNICKFKHIFMQIHATVCFQIYANFPQIQKNSIFANFQILATNYG